MSGVGVFVLAALAWFGLGALILWANDRWQRVQPATPPPVRPAHDPATCPACVAADDKTMERFDLTLWSIECEGAL